MSRFNLVSQSSFQLEVKKSRFLAQAFPLLAFSDVDHYLQQARLVTATHHCWAYRYDDQYRFSDDGEPSGTAGRPIFSAIEGQRFDHSLVVVTRWYGGVNLGTGGLVRAYGSAASECLRQAQRCELQAKHAFILLCDFSLIGTIHQLLQHYQVQKCSEQFEETGIHLHLQIPSQHIVAITTKINDLSRGTAQLIPCDNMPHEHNA